MKSILTSLIFFILLQTSHANAGLIVGYKEWSFNQTNESWNSISTRYNAMGQSNSSVLQYWASLAEVTEMFAIAKLEDLLLPVAGDYPTLLGERPSLCGNITDSCIWHGWLRDEDLIDPLLAQSTWFQGSCVPNPIPSDGCIGSLSGNAYLPKIWKDEGATGGPAITGHWVYTKVNTPPAFILFALSLFAMLFLQNVSYKR